MLAAESQKSRCGIFHDAFCKACMQSLKLAMQGLAEDTAGVTAIFFLKFHRQALCLTFSKLRCPCAIVGLAMSHIHVCALCPVLSTCISYDSGHYLIDKIPVVLFFSFSLSFFLQGEDEAMFLDYRHSLKVVFDNIAQLVSYAVLCIDCYSVTSLCWYTSMMITWLELIFS